MVDPTEPQGKWHFDKTINVAVILALLGILCTGAGAVATGVWFASNMQTRVATVEHRVDLAEPLAGQIIQLQTTVNDVKEQVTEIRRMLRVSPEQRR